MQSLNHRRTGKDEEDDAWALELEEELDLTGIRYEGRLNQCSVNVHEPKLDLEEKLSLGTKQRDEDKTALALPSVAATLPQEVLALIIGFGQVGRVCKSWSLASVAVTRRRFSSRLADILRPMDPKAVAVALDVETELFTAYGQSLVRMSGPDMANPQLARKRKEWIKKRTHEVMRDGREAEGFESDLFECRNCGSSRTRYRQWRRKAVVDRTRIIVICLRCPSLYAVRRVSGSSHESPAVHRSTLIKSTSSRWSDSRSFFKFPEDQDYYQYQPLQADPMKCANPDCTCAELATTDPGIVCGRGVHHICSDELYESGKLSERFCSAAAWEGALRRWTNTSNVKAHMVAAHEDHQLGQAEACARLEAATRNFDEATDHATASTFRDLLTGVWFKHCKKAGDFLQRELKAAHGPFLNLHHDGWTTGNGKVGVLGTSASFIDKTWTHCKIALLLTVGNPSHAATDMQRVICSRIRELYNVDISAMTQFTVSDTTASARKTSKLFEDSIVTDCTMHVLNLCLQYAIGMTENKETVEVYDPATNSCKREKRYCTVGGAFEEGRDLIKRVRALNNYFSTQQRCQRLEKMQEFYGLPKIGPTLDCDTRVAFTVKLLERSIVNYSAFQYYSQCREKGDDSSVFECLEHTDWRLMAEMESIVGPIANLARIEMQRSDLVASELIVLLKFAADRLYSNSFSMFHLNAPRDPMTTVDTFRRISISGEAFSGLARVCLARMKGQLKKRIGTATAETVLILLLDPRTKFSVESLIAPSTTPGTEKHASDGESQQSQQNTEIVSAGSKLLVDAHREMFCSLRDRDLNAVGTTATTTSRNLTLSLTLTARVLEEWLQYTVDWVATTVQQAPGKTKTSDDFAPLLLVRRNGSVCWRVEAVCEHVDILRWFREVGSSRFPSVAALARIWLGRAPSNAFQERVFSTGGIVMSNRRTRTDNYQAEMQVLLKHNQKVVKYIESSDAENVALEAHIRKRDL
ncbi:uncharacterized protein PITG_10617 [Phytophthora infestans T30-4]|uniref:HAT C-terminal dimerisation domain-containing protein n=1 Tax=Phytophthora infestans (strain T30-4) TaxID=403677 RepID=D0NFQ5_PHYIT|nr:uncharacterized protein PITG_10617 [Phytophthora infestans T30-4]EEY57044.1 conserved hypothetical protein [Phytophthora infestans T30-4]|eukprot:XP_002902372.1 conserved hypothetical protein [Phytophthora infestans T30-4]